MLTASALESGKPVDAASPTINSMRSSGLIVVTHGPPSSTPFGANSSKRLPTATMLGDRSIPTMLLAWGNRSASLLVLVPVPHPISTMVASCGTDAPSSSNAVSKLPRKASSPLGPYSGKLRAPTARPASSCSHAASQLRFPSSYAWNGFR